MSYSYKKTNEKIHEVSARIASTDAWVQPSLLSAVDSGIWIGDGCKMFYELSLSSCNRLYKKKTSIIPTERQLLMSNLGWFKVLDGIDPDWNDCPVWHFEALWIWVIVLDHTENKRSPFWQLCVSTGGTVSCHNDDLWCHQWWQNCQNDDLLFSVHHWHCWWVFAWQHWEK